MDNWAELKWELKESLFISQTSYKLTTETVLFSSTSVLSFFQLLSFHFC